ncbi:MAG: hypothetical protein AAFU85_29305 [Planctomycetota bacterium]
MTRTIQPKRRGTIMVGVLACLAVVSLLLALLVRDSLAGRRETKHRHQLSQTTRLLDAGILRATLQKKRDAGYEGETWNPRFGSADNQVPASVEIECEGNRIRVSAKIGIDPHTTTQSHQYSFGQ